jgi:DNA-binding IclR family transcriptional regulator
MGVTEVAQALGVDKSTAFHLLSTLASRGFVEQNAKDRRYRLGLRIIELGRRALDRVELRTVARSSLALLRSEIGESAHLAVFRDGAAVYIDTVETGASLNVKTEVGRSAPLHCTAIGKALAAWLSSAELAQVVRNHPLERFTPRTITTLRELELHLEIVRERGYAVDDEEFESGVRCVAAPIRDYSGRVVASLGISGPSVRIALERIPTIAQKVMAAADEVSRLLGSPEGGRPAR